jgi:hypothetical protein
MDSMFTFLFAKFIKLKFRRPLRHTNTCAIVSLSTLNTFKPDKFPFAFLLSHINASVRRAGSSQ